MRKSLFFLLGALLFSFLQLHVFAQADSAIDHTKQKNLLLSAGLGYASFRDFATSPLYYNGPGISLAIEKQTLRQKSELNWGLCPLISSTMAHIPKSNYYQSSASSSFFLFDAYAQYMRLIPHISSNKIYYKAGGKLMGTQNFRMNQSLFNSAVAAETFINFMLSLKADKDISRNTEKINKLWFITIRRKPAKRKLSFQANIGIVNINHRPPYNFLYLSPINGTENDSFSSPANAYQWSLNGWRFGTKIEFSKLATSGNGFKIAYVWDLANAPGKNEAFQMASHRIQYSLIINKNK